MKGISLNYLLAITNELLSKRSESDTDGASVANGDQVAEGSGAAGILADETKILMGESKALSSLIADSITPSDDLNSTALIDDDETSTKASLIGATVAAPKESDADRIKRLKSMSSKDFVLNYLLPFLTKGNMLTRINTTSMSEHIEGMVAQPENGLLSSFHSQFSSGAFSTYWSLDEMIVNTPTYLVIHSLDDPFIPMLYALHRYAITLPENKDCVIADERYGLVKADYERKKLTKDLFLWLDIFCIPFTTLAITSAASSNTFSGGKLLSISASAMMVNQQQNQSQSTMSTPFMRQVTFEPTHMATFVETNGKGSAVGSAAQISKDSNDFSPKNGIATAITSYTVNPDILFDKNVYLQLTTQVMRELKHALFVVHSWYAPKPLLVPHCVWQILNCQGCILPCTPSENIPNETRCSLSICLPPAEYCTIENQIRNYERRLTKELVKYVSHIPTTTEFTENENVFVNAILHACEGNDKKWRDICVVRMSQWLVLITLVQLSYLDRGRLKSQLSRHARILQCVTESLIDSKIPLCALDVIRNSIRVVDLAFQNLDKSELAVLAIIYQLFGSTLLERKMKLEIQANANPNPPSENPEQQQTPEQLEETELKEEIIRVFKKSLELSVEGYGECTPEVSQDLHSLAGALVDMKRYDEALEYCKRALEIDTQLHRNHRPKEIIESLHNVGRLLQLQGRYSEAVNYFIESLELNKQIHQANVFVVPIILDLQAIVELYELGGRYDKAQEFAFLLLSLVRQKQNAILPPINGPSGQGEGSDGTNGSGNSGTVNGEGDGSQSRSAGNSALSSASTNDPSKQKKKDDSKGNQDVVHVMRVIISIFRKQRKFLEALKLAEECLALSKQDHGRLHSEVIQDLQIMCLILRDMNNRQEETRIRVMIDDIRKEIAEIDTLRHELEKKKHEFNKMMDNGKNTDPNYRGEFRSCTRKIAELCIALNRNPEAIEFLEQSLSYAPSNEEDIHLKDPSLVADMNSLAKLCFNNHKAQRAIELYEKVLEAHKITKGPDDRSVATASFNLAVTYKSFDKFTRAEELFRDVIRIYNINEKDLDPKSKQIIMKSETHLYMVLWAQGREIPPPSKKPIRDAIDPTPEKAEKLLEAERLFRKLLEQAIEEAKGDLKNETIAKSYINLSKLLMDRNLPDLAFKECRQGTDLLREIYGPDHPTMAWALQNLAEVELYRRRISEAEALIREALRIIEKNFGKNHSIYASFLLVNLIPILRAYDDVELLEENHDMFLEALEFLKEANGENHPEVAPAMIALALLEQDLGDFYDAEDLLTGALNIYKTSYGDDLNHPNVGYAFALLRDLYVSESNKKHSVSEGEDGEEIEPANENSVKSVQEKAEPSPVIEARNEDASPPPVIIPVQISPPPAAVKNINFNDLAERKRQNEESEEAVDQKKQRQQLGIEADKLMVNQSIPIGNNNSINDPSLVNNRATQSETSMATNQIQEPKEPVNTDTQASENQLPNDAAVKADGNVKSEDKPQQPATTDVAVAATTSTTTTAPHNQATQLPPKARPPKKAICGCILS